MTIKQLYTKDSPIDKDNVLTEYPRPQFVRDSYICLNGVWNYAINQSDNFKCAPQGEILVPFSPESVLSGVGKTVTPTDFLHYFKTFEISKAFFKGKVILHFGACDTIANVYLNGEFVGSHIGGYNSFSFDITNQCKIGDNELVVVVQDFTDTSYHSRGKQSSDPKGIWYTPQSGIWQTVWLESVCENYIKSIKITPNFDDSSVDFEITPHGELDNLTLDIFDGKKLLNSYNVKDNKLTAKIENFKPWNLETPFLYDVEIKCDSDSVKSYFGMRKFGKMKDVDGFTRLTLNNKPIFHNGLLDQGYYPDGLLTPPSDEALIFDIQSAKDLGFNMLRKHIKVEPLRWYYHCDRLGMLVWQDMVNGGGKYSLFTISTPLFCPLPIKDNHYGYFARKSKEGRKQYYFELEEMIDTLYNCVSICEWTPFNEAWGQFDSKIAVDLILSKDKTRHIDHASGWYDQKIGDFKSTHVYYKPIKVYKDERAFAVTEFGGYSYYIKERAFNQDDFFGYKKFTSKAEFQEAYKTLFETEIIPNIKKGLSASVYTQLTDVENEVNGIFTYDREELKIDADCLKEINSRIKF